MSGLEDPRATVQQRDGGNRSARFGTPEFCAPEVVSYQPVSLSTDMWTVGVISYGTHTMPSLAGRKDEEGMVGSVLLSGLSPFLGENDEETLANVAAGDWDFDDPAWDAVSDLGKDFICKLMVKDRR